MSRRSIVHQTYTVEPLVSIRPEFHEVLEGIAFTNVLFS